MNTIDVDLSSIADRHLKQPTPRASRTEDHPRLGKQNLTVEGDAWREKMIGPGEVQITIPDVVPWTGEDENPNRIYRATFGEGGYYRDLEHVREILRGAIEIKREEIERAERLRLWGIEVKVLAAIELRPGITTTQLRDAVGGTGKETDSARNALLDRGVIMVLDGPKNAKHHHLGQPDAAAAARVEPQVTYEL